MRAAIPALRARDSSRSNSGSLSTLKIRMPLFNAWSISDEDFPTPEKTTLSAA
jgi:hypothetical protein